MIPLNFKFNSNSKSFSNRFLIKILVIICDASCFNFEQAARAMAAVEAVAHRADRSRAVASLFTNGSASALAISDRLSRQFSTH